jgi:hypothetical protein
LNAPLSIAAGHAFQNGSHLKLNASIVSGHAFENASQLNAALLHQVMPFKMAAI